MSSADKKDDPFTRRKCQPTLVTLVHILATTSMHDGNWMNSVNSITVYP